MAKELILRSRALRLPAWSDGDLSFPSTTLDVGEDSVAEISILGGQLRPDLRVTGQALGVLLSDLYVEIKVSHAVDWRKSAVVQHHGISMMEIDLSEATDEEVADLTSFETMVLRNPANRSWINISSPGLLAAALGRDVVEITSASTYQKSVAMKSGNVMHFDTQRGALYRAGEPSRQFEFELADTYRDGQRIDGIGNLLPYSPGLYFVAAAPPTPWFWKASQRYKTFLQPIRARRTPPQTQLFLAGEP